MAQEHTARGSQSRFRDSSRCSQSRHGPLLRDRHHLAFSGFYSTFRMMDCANPRPAKRQRKESAPDELPELQSLDLNAPSPRTLSSRSRQMKPASASIQRLRPLPAPVLLSSLPSLLMHPPIHRLHPTSLMLSLTSVKKLLSAPALNPDVECRAWTMWAEIGMCIIDGGYHERNDCSEWAGKIVGEVRRVFLKREKEY